MTNSKRMDVQKADWERIRRRVNTYIDPDNYEYIPAKEPADYYNNEVHQSVGIYVRVSTDQLQQASSYELQKKYYEDFVTHHPNWTLVAIYADRGISGTSRKHRDAFNRMIDDCKHKKLTLIICKSVSRFARNVADCIGIVRDLASLKPPVGVFFESECIFSLKEDSQMGLTFLATMAEEESHTRSRSMETSLRMRLDNGLPLTPKLLGYTHDADGNLIVNEREAPTVKLAFYMYLYGYSTQQIAEIFNVLGKRTFLGNTKWTAKSVLQILRNERYCGDVLTRKTFTPNYRDHLSRKNRGERPQSRYRNHHQGIISRDDFIAVQRMLDNAKYKNRSILPKLQVIPDGVLKGFVGINPRWSGFHAPDYLHASQSICPTQESCGDPEADISPIPYEFEVSPGEFDLRGFEIAGTELFDSAQRMSVSFGRGKLRFSMSCVQRFGTQNYVELLIHPARKILAIRPVEQVNRNGIYFSKQRHQRYYPREISMAAFGSALFTILGWKSELRYRIIGSCYEHDGVYLLLFDTNKAEAFFPPHILSQEGETAHLLTLSGNQIRAVPSLRKSTFGEDFYAHERPLTALAHQSEADWKLRMEGQMFEVGRRLSVTSFEALRTYICSQIGEIRLLGVGRDG